MNSIKTTLKTKLLLCLAMVLGAIGAITNARAEAVADVMVGYSATWRAGMGGTDQTNAAIYNQMAGANNIAAASGSPHRQNVIGTKESAHDPTNEVNCGGMIGWMSSYNVNIRDVIDQGNSLGADLFAYIGDMANNGAAAQAEQPGRFSCYEQAWWWQNVAAHESGGHNYGCDHAVGHSGPTTIMLHNYCGGSQPFYSNPNIWLNGVKLLGDGSCIGYLAQGGDAAYLLSNTAQGRADIAERKVWGSNLYPIVRRWKFNKPLGTPATAGEVIADDIGADPATIRGLGAWFTGNGLKLPGGTTGNTAASSIAAYIDLPNGIFKATPNFTVEVWATPVSPKAWMRVLEIGRPVEAGDGLGEAGEYTGTPGSPAPGVTAGSDVIGVAAVGSNETLASQRLIAGVDGTLQTSDSTLATNPNEMHHYAVTFADTTTGGMVKWFRDGILIKTLNVTFHSASLEDVNIWLGRSLWSGDQMANIEYHDVRIQSIALADAQVAGNYRIGPFDAKSTLWANDGYGNSGFVNGGWEFGATPVATRDYETGTMMLRTPKNASNVTFPGKSLAITGGNLHLNATGPKTTTIADLRLNGGTVGSFAEGGGTQTLAGNIKLSTWDLNHIRGAWGQMVISSNISTVPGSGQGILVFTENATTLTGNNTGYTGAMWVGDGRFSTLKISSETNLGGNPPWYAGDWLKLDRGILETTQTMSIDDANRGVQIGPSGGFLRPAAGTTLTLASTLNSPAAGNTLQTAAMFPNPVVGYFFKDGGGTLVLTNPNNSYIGETVINEGELRLDGAGRLNNGDMHMPLTLNSTLNVNTTGDQIFGGIISGGGTFIKGNTGTTTFYAANTFTGSVTVNGGTVYARAANAANNRAFSYASGITVNNGGTLRAGANGLFGWDGTQEKAITVNAGGTLTADGNADVGVGTVTLAGGTLANLGASTAWGSWRFDGASDKLLVSQDSTASATNVKFGDAAATLEVAAGKTLNFTGTITNATNGGISFLTKTGTGTLTLASANTHTGATAVNAGTLKLTGSLAAGSAVTVASGATLTGTGTVGGSLSFAANATHAPGNAVGTQTVSGVLGYANGSRVKWALLSNSNAAGTSSRVAAGTVNITSGAALDLVLNGAGSSTNFANGFWNQSRSWTVMTGTITGSFTLGSVSADSTAKSVSTYGTFALQQNATTVTLSFTPTPAVVTLTWQQANFGASWNDPAVAGDSADPDLDGIPNLLERAFGGNPNVSDTGILPTKDDTAPLLSIVYRKSVAASDLTFSVLESATMSAPWTTAIGTSETMSEQDGVQRIRFTSPAAGSSKKFLRVQVGAP